MAKMGYIIGTGLGKHSEGRVEPVEAEVLPEGSVSLDAVMELRENRRLKRLKPTKTKKSRRLNEAVEEPPEIDLFDFINNKLITEEPTLKKNISKTIINAVPLSKNSKGLNIQMLETHNQIQQMEKVVSKYKESLLRNKNR